MRDNGDVTLGRRDFLKRLAALGLVVPVAEVARKTYFFGPWAPGPSAVGDLATFQDGNNWLEMPPATLQNCSAIGGADGFRVEAGASPNLVGCSAGMSDARWIQMLLDEAARNGSRSVRLPTRSYRIDEPIVLPSRVSLSGGYSTFITPPDLPFTVKLPIEGPWGGIEKLTILKEGQQVMPLTLASDRNKSTRVRR